MDKPKSNLLDPDQEPAGKAGDKAPPAPSEPMPPVNDSSGPKGEEVGRQNLRRSPKDQPRCPKCKKPMAAGHSGLVKTYYYCKPCSIGIHLPRPGAVEALKQIRRQPPPVNVVPRDYMDNDKGDSS